MAVLRARRKPTHPGANVQKRLRQSEDKSELVDRVGGGNMAHPSLRWQSCGSVICVSRSVGLFVVQVEEHLAKLQTATKCA